MVAVSAAADGMETRKAAAGFAAAPAISYRECKGCGRMNAVEALPEGSAARCDRCNTVLRNARRNPVNRTLAFALSALALFSVATFTPLLTMSISGQQITADLTTGSLQLDKQGFWVLGILVGLTTILAPAARLATSCYVLMALRMTRPPMHLAPVFRWSARLKPWSMIEVYLLAIFVAYAKLVDMAQVEVGIAVIAFAGVMIAMIAADVALDPDVVWEAIDRRERAAALLPPDRPGKGAVGCECCGFVSTPPKGSHAASCPRCGSPLHRRKPDSIARAWALAIAAIVLYIPANLYPVMTVVSLGRGAPDTIMSGVIELAHAGMWPLALLVFFASITVPVLKLIALIYLLVTTQLGSAKHLRRRTVMYRLVEGIGRWSMIDIFMLSILVGLVRLGNLATIEPGIGAISFAGVVILTMFAAECFDPRLMWDAAEAAHPTRSPTKAPERPSPGSAHTSSTA